MVSNHSVSGGASQRHHVVPVSPGTHDADVGTKQKSGKSRGRESRAAEVMFVQLSSLLACIAGHLGHGT